MQIQDQENTHVNKGKNNVVAPQKRRNLIIRALGDVDINIEVSRDVHVGKVATAAAEIDKASQNRAPLRRWAHELCKYYQVPTFNIRNKKI